MGTESHFRAQIEQRFPDAKWEGSTRETVDGLLANSYARKLYNPLDDTEATERLTEQIRDWRKLGRAIVFGSGVYDLMHPNHVAFFAQTRMAAVGALYDAGRYDRNIERSWAELSDRERLAVYGDVADDIRLIESVDGNDAVASRKGGKADKGNSARPILDWHTRATSIAAVGHTPTGRGMLPLVDAVTIHDNVVPEFVGTPHEGIMQMGTFVRPDVWGVFCESDDVLEAAEQDPYLTRLGRTSLVVLDGHNFYHDALLGTSLSTTPIVRRVKGEL